MSGMSDTPTQNHSTSLFALYESMAAPYPKFVERSTYSPTPQDNNPGITTRVKNAVQTGVETTLGFLNGNIPTKEGFAGAVPTAIGTKIVRAEVIAINEGKRFVEVLNKNLVLLQVLQKDLEVIKNEANKSTELAKMQPRFNKIAKAVDLPAVAAKINVLKAAVKSFSNVNEDDPSLAALAQIQPNPKSFLESQKEAIRNLDTEQSARNDVLRGSSGTPGLIALEKQFTTLLESVRLDLVIQQNQVEIDEIQTSITTNFSLIDDLTPMKLVRSFKANQARSDAETKEVTTKIDAAIDMFQRSIPIFKQIGSLKEKMVNQKFAENFKTLAALNESEANKLLSQWNKACIDLNCLELQLAVFKGIANAVLKTNSAQIEGEAIFFAIDGAEKHEEFKARWKKPFVDLVRLPDFASHIFKARPVEAGQEAFDLTLQDLSIAKELNRLLHISQNLREMTNYVGEANQLGFIALKANDDNDSKNALNKARSSCITELSNTIEQTSSYKPKSSNNIFTMLNSKFVEAKPLSGFFGMLGYKETLDESVLK